MPVPTQNANDLLPDDLYQECLDALADSDARRVTFRTEGELTPTEMVLGRSLAERARKYLKGGTVRLYFSQRTQTAGRPPHPFRDRALKLVNERHHRVEAVAFAVGCHRQSIVNWGGRQPPREARRGDADGPLMEIGLAHAEDMYDLASVEAVAEHFDVSEERAEVFLRRVGAVILDMEAV